MTTAIYPGSFDPIHNGHIDIACRAAQIFDQVIVAVYDRPLKSLLFNTTERLALVEQALGDVPRLRTGVFNSLLVEYAQQVGARVIVRGLRVFSDFELEFRMALTNRRLAPEIEVVCLITNEEHTFLSSSTVKEVASLRGNVGEMVPPHVARALETRFTELGEDGPNSMPIISLRD
jgi:pantetheine-phosphate adenylyltransferase